MIALCPRCHERSLAHESHRCPTCKQCGRATTFGTCLKCRIAGYAIANYFPLTNAVVASHESAIRWLDGPDRDPMIARILAYWRLPTAIGRATGIWTAGTCTWPAANGNWTLNCCTG